MSILLEQVNWPVILLQQDSVDLLLVESSLDWSEQTDMLGVLKGSYIIDDTGNSYLINKDLPTRLQLASPQISLEQLRSSVQQYASQNGHCCTSKLTINTIEQLFEVVAFIEQN